MKKLEGEYTIKIKITGNYYSNANPEETPDNLIKELGRKRIMAYLSGNMFDPTGKIIQEEIKINEV